MTSETPIRPVIDVCGVVYDADSWRANLNVFAERAPGYLRFFAGTFAANAGADPAEYESALAESPHAAVDLLVTAGGLAADIDSHAADLRSQGVRHQVLHGAQATLGAGETVNDRVAAAAARHPDLLSAWVGLDPGRPEAALEELERGVHELGMRGATMVTFSAGVDPDATECHKIYARVAELGIPLWMHTGMNLAANRPLASTTWTHVDHIAVAHPDLLLIAGHGGWPWVLEGMAVMQRHPNVYLEFSAHRPKIMGKPGSGWEPLLFYGRTVLRDKVMFGTAGFVQRHTVRQLADEVAELGLGDAVTGAWLHDNAARLLSL